MARIRTVKPEFWTDSVIVQLPFEARLLFIGLWNFCDDQGFLVNEPERLRMQVFPSEPSIDLASLLDLLVSAERLEVFAGADGESLLKIKNFEKHQRVDNPSKPRFSGAKKRAIPNSVRRAVAAKYGCEQGKEKKVACFYCGCAGRIHWWKLRSGKPSSWVTTTLEFDHFEAEAAGGEGETKNIVLACRACNRSKGVKEFAEMWPCLARPREPSPPEGNGMEKEGNGREEEPSAAPQPEFDSVFSAWQSIIGKPNAKPTKERRRKVKERLAEGYSVGRLISAIRGCKRSPHHQGKNNTGTKYEDLELICRDGKHVEMFEALVEVATPPDDRPRWEQDGFADEASYRAHLAQIVEETRRVRA